MPEVQHTTEVAADLTQIWDFVKDMDNWAPLLTGYESHQKVNDDESVWRVKGELSGMTRTAVFRVHVTEWAGPERVTFVMEGLEDPVKGSGSFLASAIGGDADAVDFIPQVPANWFVRLRNNLSRWLLNRVFSQAPVRAVAAATRGGSKTSRITFKLALTAGGATGPVLNLLLAPMLAPVAEAFANSIAGEVEARVNQCEAVA